MLFPLAVLPMDAIAYLGPVQPAEELLSIVSPKDQLLLEVKVLNRDIGFVRQGMPVKIKMATFPFQEFGTVKGEVVKVSPNAIRSLYSFWFWQSSGGNDRSILGRCGHQVCQLRRSLFRRSDLI